jgi:hypothetical protein
VDGVTSAFILFFTIVTVLILGILVSYAAVNGLFSILAPRRKGTPSPTPAAALIPSHTHASGD